jgi:hypothetical protein
MRWCRSLRSRITIYCPACVATFLFKLGRREARWSFSAQQRSRATPASAICCWIAPELESMNYVQKYQNPLQFRSTRDGRRSSRRIPAVRPQDQRFNKPSRANEKLFQDAVDEIAGVVRSPAPFARYHCAAQESRRRGRQSQSSLRGAIRRSLRIKLCSARDRVVNQAPQLAGHRRNRLGRSPPDPQTPQFVTERRAAPPLTGIHALDGVHSLPFQIVPPLPDDRHGSRLPTAAGCFQTSTQHPRARFPAPLQAA